MYCVETSPVNKDWMANKPRQAGLEGGTSGRGRDWISGMETGTEKGSPWYTDGDSSKILRTTWQPHGRT